MRRGVPGQKHHRLHGDKDGIQLAASITRFAGVGRLCYGSHESKALRVNISAGEEATLFNRRLMDLVFNPLKCNQL